MKILGRADPPLGLPKEYVTTSVHYCGRSSIALRAIANSNPEIPRRRIFFREIEKTKFVELPYDHSEIFSYQDRVVCQASAGLFFLQLEITYYQDRLPGLNWCRLCHCDLESHRVTSVVNADERQDKLHLSSIIGFDESRSALFCTAARCMPEELESETRYSLVEIDSQTGQLREVLAALESQIP